MKSVFLLIYSAFSLVSAHSATIIEPLLDTGLQTTELSSIPLNFRYFDSNLGTLTGVSLTITGLFSAEGTVGQSSPTPQSFVFKQDMSFFFTDNDGPLDSIFESINLNMFKQQNYTDLAPNEFADFGPYVGASAATASTTLNSFPSLSPFAMPGGGVDTVYVSTLTGNAFYGGGGNNFASISTMGQATIGVTYTYTPAVIPEPSSALLVCMALLGVGMRRRRPALL